MALIAYSPSSGMTLGSLVEGILVSLYGQTSQTDSAASLVEDISASALSFKVDDPSDFSAGYVEIDTELIRVISVDLSTAVVTIAPRGRGHRGTVAAAHTAGAEVRIQPIVPYRSVIRDVQAELATIYPRISATCSHEFTPDPSVHSYTLPTDAGLVLDVRYLDNTNEWQRVRDWGVEHGGSAGPVLRIPSIPGSTVRVIYGKPFGQLANLTDPLAAAGIPESLEDVIRYGVLCRILPTLDIARLSVTATAGSDMNNRPPTPGTGVMVARELRAAYRERLDQEIKTFRSYFPVRLHRIR
ncbi:hypothetical protein UB45_07835 [Terrabacter sp. 28]|nr:hypothetical protein UB45_07835 [Terrabacter sp. 28]